MNIHDRETVVEVRCEQLRRERTHFNYINAIVGFYITTKVVALFSGSELPYITDPWHEDMLAIILGAIFGYGLINIGVEYLRVTAALQKRDHEFTKQELHAMTTIPFFRMDERDFTIGYLLTGVGIGMILLSIVMVLVASI
jgi:hypothetical protein